MAHGFNISSVPVDQVRPMGQSFRVFNGVLSILFIFIVIRDDKI